MKSLSDCIKEQVSLEPMALDHILGEFEPVELKKGDYFLTAGTVCRKMAFIESGHLRMFDTVDGKEITFWIGGGGKFITSLSSFVFETSNIWNIQAVTDCKLQVISRTNHFQLSASQPKWLEFYNLLLAHSFALLEKSMFAQLHTTAKERFDDLMEHQPELFQHIPLQYIASMLGITPESLSRLRKNAS